MYTSTVTPLTSTMFSPLTTTAVSLFMLHISASSKSALRRLLQLDGSGGTCELGLRYVQVTHLVHFTKSVWKESKAARAVTPMMNGGARQRPSIYIDIDL